MKDLQGKISKINSLIKEVNENGKRVKALGKYLVLEDIEKVDLSDKTI